MLFRSLFGMTAFPDTNKADLKRIANSPLPFACNPKDKRFRCAVLVETDHTRILIDAGPDIRMQLLRVPFRKLDGVLITHIHYDHVGGMDDLRGFCKFGDIQVYGDGLVTSLQLLEPQINLIQGYMTTNINITQTWWRLLSAVGSTLITLVAWLGYMALCMVKNSWGEYGDYKGTWYMTKAFVAYKTMDFMVNKNALPKDIRKKLGI